MENKARRDRFWLFLSAILITIFVIQRESGNRVQFHLPHQEARSSSHDRQGMMALVSRGQAEPPRRAPVYAASDDDLITGSIGATRHDAPTPLARPGSMSLAVAEGRYYVMLGSFGTIEGATARYIDILNRDPDLRGNERVSIETVKLSDGQRLHNVRMGAFGSDNAARAACARATLAPADSAVVAL